MQSRASKITLWITGILLIPVLVYWLFADRMIKSVLEAQFTQAHGAEVNIGKFGHQLFPVKVEISDVGFTDAAHPEHNQLVIERIAGDVELKPLLSGQVIMNQLDLLGVAFNQPRATPGKVLREPQGQNFAELLNEAKEALPDVGELLERSPLKTTAAVANAKQAYDSYAKDLEDNYKALPDKERLSFYQAEVKKLRDTNYKDPAELLKAKTAFDKLKEQMQADKESIITFKDKASEARTALSASLKALKEAPKQDYELLKGIYSGDQAALSQLTTALFGEKAAQYNQYLFAAFDILVPLLQGGGETAAVNEQGATPPEVLVRNANVSVNWQDTLLTGEWKNITNMHTVFGNPTTFLLNTATSGRETFSTEGEFFIDDMGLDASQQWNIAGLLLNNITLSDNIRLDASIKQALMATSGSLKITDNMLDGSSRIDLTELTMTAAGNDKITRTIAGLLDNLKQLDIKMDIGGSLFAPDFGFSSDLDNQLASAALSALSASQQSKLTELNTALNKMVGAQNERLTGELGDISTWLTNSQNNEAALQTLLQTQLKSVVEQQKDKLFEKLFKKADGR